jgi:hypothetical protein
LSPTDLLRDFLRVAGNSLSRRGKRERLWSKVLSDTPNGRVADSGVNEKRFCMTTPLMRKLLNPFGRYHFDLNRMRRLPGEIP